MSSYLLEAVHNDFDIVSVVNSYFYGAFEDSFVTGDGQLMDVDIQLFWNPLRTRRATFLYGRCRDLDGCIEEQNAVHFPFGIQYAVAEKLDLSLFATGHARLCISIWFYCRYIPVCHHRGLDGSRWKIYMSMVSSRFCMVVFCRIPLPTTRSWGLSFSPFFLLCHGPGTVRIFSIQ